MLDVVAVTKAFGDKVALQEVSLAIPAGICYGLLGPNGAGKTTLISILTGTQRADGGTVTLGGELIDPDRHRVKRQLGYVPQDLALYEDLSAQENLRFFGGLYRLTGRELQIRIEEGLELSGLTDRRTGRVSEFSGGMKRRLNLAIALLHRPAFLVLDEPTVGVDPQSRNLIFEALERLVQSGLTILYTTHYMEEVERLCDRVAIMDGGRVVAEDRKSELLRLVPDQHRVTIELERGVDGLDTLVPEATVQGNRATFVLDDLTVELPKAISSLSDLGATVRDVQIERKSLEQVFLRLTGHSLRD